jgi:predicted nucleic acid-binding protein
MNNIIKTKAITNARRYKLKLADSIILATAQTNNFSFLTADSVFKRIAQETNDVLFIVP